MTEVEKLMREYFENLDESKKIKRQRAVNGSNRCFGEDCIYDGTDEDNFCDNCKKKHKMHKRVVELGYKRTGIILKVRSKLNKMK